MMHLLLMLAYTEQLGVWQSHGSFLLAAEVMEVTVTFTDSLFYTLVIINVFIIKIITEFSGWVNDFLSWEAFQPLGKLTYIIYLLTPFQCGSRRAPKINK